jgi:hypothetical protein
MARHELLGRLADHGETRDVAYTTYGTPLLIYNT